MMAFICMSFFFFGYMFQDGRPAAILLLKRVCNHLLDMHDPILFKHGTSTVHNNIHLHLTLFCDPFKDGRLVAISVEINMATPLSPYSKITKTMGAMTFYAFFSLFYCGPIICGSLIWPHYQSVVFYPLSSCSSMSLEFGYKNKFFSENSKMILFWCK